MAHYQDETGMTPEGRAGKAAIPVAAPAAERVAELPRATFPNHAAASRIAEAAREMGYRVRRSAADPASGSTYVYCNEIKVRVANHPASRAVDIDVHADDHPRPGSVCADTAIEWLKGKLP